MEALVNVVLRPGTPSPRYYTMDMSNFFFKALLFRASWELGGESRRLVSGLGMRFVTSTSGVTHFDTLDSHALALYTWEARCADRWKFSKMHSLGMSAVHTGEGKGLEPSEA